MTPKFFVRGLVLMAGFVLLAWGPLALGLGSASDVEWVERAVRGHGAAGVAMFLAAGGLAAAAGMPRQAICFVAGYGFGFGWGCVVSSAASLLGCVAAFYYARLLGRNFLRRRFPARVQKIDAFLKEHPVSMTVLVRFLPVGSNLLTNLAAGVSSVAAPSFFLGSVIGYLPQTVVFVLLGSGTRIDAVWRIAASVALFFVSAALGVVLYRRKNSLN
jgi:uncharacterized membrane protein YdjX (TVP38/TMEM64 family)